jgi:hypothetical protein
MKWLAGSLIAGVTWVTLACVPMPAAAQQPGRGRTPAPKPGPVPRMSDGKPDLTGYWSMASLRFGGNLAQGHEEDVPYTEAGRLAFKNHDAKDDPTGLCQPPGCRGCYTLHFR